MAETELEKTKKETQPGMVNLVEELKVNHKGKTCFFNDYIFCQEGYCKECEIYLVRYPNEK
jgi:hypothetical protein